MGEPDPRWWERPTWEEELVAVDQYFGTDPLKKAIQALRPERDALKTELAATRNALKAGIDRLQESVPMELFEKRIAELEDLLVEADERNNKQVFDDGVELQKRDDWCATYKHIIDEQKARISEVTDAHRATLEDSSQKSKRIAELELQLRTLTEIQGRRAGDPEVVRVFRERHEDLRYGTCVDCPLDANGTKMPRLCVNTKRYDHNIR